jgi:hypothetical protein
VYAIEFEADVQNGMIKIPSQYQAFYGKHIKVIALLEDSETIKPVENISIEEQSQYSDEYIKEHWRELIMTSSDPLQDDDEVLQEEYGAYLSAKHSA